MPEHGFLAGKKFTFYPTIDKYNFSEMSLRIEIEDKRNELKVKTLKCSSVEISNKSEFVGNYGTSKVYEYFQFLLPQSGIRIEQTSNEVLKTELIALDCRLFGFGEITAHGLCEMKITYKNISKTYCIDITDKDKHCPISSNSWVTRKTATRIMTSAAIREVIELFLIDLKSVTKQ